MTEACTPPIGTVTVLPGDPRYEDLTTRGYNGRFIGRPESVRVVGSADQVLHVIDEAAQAGKRIAVRSGGHCFENFVDDAAVQVLVDMSEMKSVSFDPQRHAFAVEPGATLGQVYRTIYLGWGVTIPGGSCTTVGVGGHIAGGGYGQLSRKHGLVVDHLYAVEVVVVDWTGRARRVVATREPTDPNRDLWWAFTGGGGGNFGVVTRYWLRSPDATGDDPAKLLPVPPAALLKCSITWQWKDLTEQAFTTIVGNHGEFHAHTVGPESGLSLAHRVAGTITVDATLDAATPRARQTMDDYVAALTADVDVPHTTNQVTTSWMKAALAPSPWSGGARFKSKAAFLRKPWSAAQIATIYGYLSKGGPERWGGAVYLTTFGGKVNTVAPSATAMVHRDAIFSAVYETLWVEPAETEQQLAWIRELYRDVYASTGGVPVPNAANSGAYINYPDADLADPQWNTSGVPWHALYYGDNYPRLQQIKARWDPRDIFRHALSSRV